MLTAWKDFEVALAACCSIGVDEFLLQLGEYVIVRSALKHKEWWQFPRLPAVENLLRIALGNGFPRVKVPFGALEHLFAAHLFRVQVTGVGIADRGTGHYV